MTEDDELYWRKWRNSLKLIPIHIQGQQITIIHDRAAQPEELEATCILSGPNGVYLDGYTTDDRTRRVYEIRRVSSITTSDGVAFDSVVEWLAHRATIAPVVADDMGIMLPDEKDRR
ncbi:hypothetical protein [Croceicoccus gelatinilyticus]|uniref:hypothetical protein n=1 Tax=Croceicoccus gelatinilyticus TaxID=2835536 RepID=UPI001BCADD29|nr:hypothetical protein [Croceicoccus gelatinilyticus]MBS7669332.1 hypothetical protein [Croceicoccus gelatinilyticus]